MAQLQYDATGKPVLETAETHPPGWYIMQVVKSDVKQNSKKSGMLLSLDLTILHPQEMQGKKYFESINIQHTNPTAQEIGQKTLSSFCHGVGRLHINNSEDLHNVPIGVLLGVKDGQNILRNVKSAQELGKDAAWADPNAKVEQRAPAAQAPPPAWQQGPPAAQAPAWQAPPPAPNEFAQGATIDPRTQGGAIPPNTASPPPESAPAQPWSPPEPNTQQAPPPEAPTPPTSPSPPPWL